MKIFQATIECNNTCYVETVLVVAENETQADSLLCKHEKRRVTYKNKLEEIELDLKTPHVIPMVGFGENDNDYGSIDDD